MQSHDGEVMVTLEVFRHELRVQVLETMERNLIHLPRCLHVHFKSFKSFRVKGESGWGVKRDHLIVSGIVTVRVAIARIGGSLECVAQCRALVHEVGHLAVRERCGLHREVLQLLTLRL